MRLEQHATIARDGYNLLRVGMGSQSGTHVDAPYHFAADGARVDAVDLRLCTGAGVVVDATGLPPRGRIAVEHLQPVLGRLGPGVVVLLRTDWSQHQASQRYLEHPYLDSAACQALLDVGVRTIGIDAPSLDETAGHPDEALPADGYPCHRLVAAAGGLIAENLTALAEAERLLDPLVCLFPLRLAGADGSPVRAVAMEWRDAPTTLQLPGREVTSSAPGTRPRRR